MVIRLDPCDTAVQTLPCTLHAWGPRTAACVPRPRLDHQAPCQVLLLESQLMQKAGVNVSKGTAEVSGWPPTQGRCCALQRAVSLPKPSRRPLRAPLAGEECKLESD